MAAIFTCDGCNQPVAEPKQIGFVLKRDYCEACAVKAKAFLDAQESMLKELRAVFAAARQDMIEAAGTFKLPDVA